MGHESQMKVLEDSYKHSQIELEKQIDSLSSQYSKDLRSKEQAIKDIEKSFSIQFDTMKADKCSLQNSVNQLHRLTNQINSSHSDSRIASWKMKFWSCKGLCKRNVKSGLSSRTSWIN